MRLKAILHPAAKPRAASLIAAGGLIALAAAASLSAGAALAQAADKAEGGASGQSVNLAAAGAPKYVVAMKLLDGGNVVASPRLIVAEGQPARVEVGSDKRGYKVTATIKRLNDYVSAISVEAYQIKDGVTTVIGKPRITMRNGTVGSVSIADKLSVELTPFKGAISPSSQAKYKNATASDMQRYCASGDASDDSWCAGMMIGFAPNETIAKANGICLPTGVMDNTALKQARSAIAAATPQAGETAGAFARSVLEQTFTCPGWRVSRSDKANFSAQSVDISAERVTLNNVSVYEGHPTITGAESGNNTILVDGKPTAAGFNVSSIRPDKIARIEVHTNTSGPKPQNVINVITKPE